MDHEADDDVHERPTLPSPPPESLRFATADEAFFAVGPVSVLASITSEEDELAAWWAAQRRRAHASWVAGVMAVCVAVLAMGALR